MIEVSSSVPAEEPVGEILAAAAEAALKNQGMEGDISFSVVDDEEIHAINLEYRSVDRPTDVISFPAREGEALLAPPDGFLGDIAVSLPRAREQAAEYGHSLRRELSFLAVHGTLHLLGYDHQNEADEKQMFALQQEILDEMGILR